MRETIRKYVCGWQGRNKDFAKGGEGGLEIEKICEVILMT